MHGKPILTCIDVFENCRCAPFLKVGPTTHSSQVWTYDITSFKPCLCIDEQKKGAREGAAGEIKAG
jgi:hypothetical protein